MDLRRKQRLLVFIGCLGIAAATGVGIAAWWPARLPHRFAVVDPGRLYRSGTISPLQLARLRDGYGVRRVISLLDPSALESVAERAAALQLGLIWENVSLSGDGASTPADRERLRGLLLEPNAPLTLVHCAAGVNRTGLAVGMYRLHVQHWSYAQVLAELRDNHFSDDARHRNLVDALAAEAALAASSNGLALTP